MSAHGAHLPHYVTVISTRDEDGEWEEPRIEFRCPWLYGACHFYPTCGCEHFGPHHLADNGPGHEPEHHGLCWMDDWFTADGTVYDGDDADDMRDNCVPRGMNRSGPIEIGWELDYITWHFKEPAATPIGKD